MAKRKTPGVGGSFVRDPKTGELTRIDDKGTPAPKPAVAPSSADDASSDQKAK